MPFTADKMKPTSKFPLIFLVMVATTLILMEDHFAAACSSRTLPKPRPSSSISAGRTPKTTAAPTTTTTTPTTTTTTTTQRPNITFPTYKCPTTYDAWYCLNEATCFSVRIGDSIMYNCECALGFMGPRCEYKELDGSYLPKRPRPILEKASIASGATCALLFILFICLTMYLRYDHKTKSVEADETGGSDYGGDYAAAKLSKCRFCNDKRCCGDAGLLVDAEKYRFRQHIETFPMSFAIKRTKI